MNKLVFVAIALALVACGKKDGGKADKGDKGGGAATVDPGPANAAVPAAWKPKLEFAATKIEDDFDKEAGAITAVVPKGWVPGKGIKTMREPPESSKDFGFGAHLWAGKTCSGECKAKSAAEWEAAATKDYFGNLLGHTPPPKVIKDDKQPGHRVVVAEDTYTGGQVNNTTIMSVWWKDGGERMYFCTAVLPPESKDVVPAFEQACSQKPAD